VSIGWLDTEICYVEILALCNLSECHKPNMKFKMNNINLRVKGLLIIVIRLWAGWLEFNTWQGNWQDLFLFTTVFRLVLGATQLPILWVLGG